MRKLLLLLALGLAGGDKLDRTYLPPPGSKYAGGDPGDLQAPLEYPKESYTTTAPLKPGQKTDGSVTIGDTRLVPGSARRPGSKYPGQLKDTVSVTSDSKSPFNYFQKTYKVPTTTTSYAFTQTTTFPPTEGFETTPIPIGPGFPFEGSLDEHSGFINQPFSQGQIIDQQTGQIRPGFVQPGSQPIRPGLLPTPGPVTSGAEKPFPGQGQSINQYQQSYPTSTTSPLSGSSLQLGLATSSHDQGYTQHLGVQPPRQFNQQGFIPSFTAAPGYKPGFSSQYNENISNIQGTKIAGQQPAISPTVGPQQGTTQYVDKYGNVQTVGPGFTVPPQEGGEQKQPQYPGQIQYDGDQNAISGPSGTVVTSPQGQRVPQTFGPQGSLTSTVSPQGTTVTGFTPGQQQEPGRPQYFGESGFQSPEQYQGSNIPGLSGFQQQGGQSQQFGGKQPNLEVKSNNNPQQYVNQQGTFPSTGIFQGTSRPGTFVDQSQNDQRHPSAGQQTIYPAEITQGVTPGTITQQQLGGQQPQITSQQVYPTSSVSQGPGILPSNQLSRQPQFTGQQGSFSSTLAPQGTTSSGLAINQQLGTQQPQTTGHQGSFSSTFASPEITSSGLAINQQPGVQQLQTTGQQGSYPSTISPQEPGIVSSNQHTGQPQHVGQQSSFGQTFNQKPGNQQPQVIGQQSVFPSTGISQGFTSFESTSSQLGGQEPQFDQQSYRPSEFSDGIPTSTRPGFFQPSGNLNNINGSILPGSTALPGQTTFVTSQPITPQSLSPTSQPQLTPSQQSITARPGEQSIATGSLQNVYTPGIAGSFQSVPSGYQQSFSPSTTPSSIPTYGTTPSGFYSSSTSPYSGFGTGTLSTANVGSRPERPQADADRNAVILNYENILTPDGYAYSYDTSNGIHADENGTTIDGTKANGSYSYTGDDGKFYHVVYTADENGFQPHGDHLPTPPPVPKAIQRVIEQAARDKAAGISHDGFYDEDKYGHKKYQRPKHRHPGMQFINGADIPDDYESTYYVGDKNNISKPKGGKTPGAYKGNEQDLNEYEDTKYDGIVGITAMDKDENHKQPHRKIASGRPTTKQTGKYDYEAEQNKGVSRDEETQLTGQRRPIPPERDSSRRRLNSSSHKERPGLSTSDYDDKQRYDDGKILEESEEYVNNKDRKIPAKTTEGKYSISEDNSRRMKLPGRFDSKQQTAIRKPQEDRRPGMSSTQDEESSNDLKNKISKDRRPGKPISGPSKTFGTKYYVTDDGSAIQEDSQEPTLSSQEAQDVTSRPTGTKNIGSTKIRYEQREQDMNRRRPSTAAHGSKFDNVNYLEGSRFEQKGRPTYDQRTDVSDNKYAEQPEDEETGYQYTPPRNKFKQGEKNTFPSRLSDKAVTSTKYNVSEKKTTVKPFITPNVHRDDYDNYEDVSQENISLKRPEKKPGKVTALGTTSEYETSDEGLEYFDRQNKPGQPDEERITTSKIRPGRPDITESGQRPRYQSQETTGKPGDYDEHTSNAEERMYQRDSKRPGYENTDRYPADSDEQKRTGQEYSQTFGTSRKPGSSYVSSTTPMPFKKPYLPESKRPSQQQKDQYLTANEPSGTSSIEEDYSEDETRPRPSSSKSGSRRPINTPDDFSDVSKPATEGTTSSTRTPSSSPTSRPSYEYSDKTSISGSRTRPSVFESSFSKPSSRPISTQPPGYSTVRPDPSNNGYYDSEEPGSYSSEYSTPEKGNYPDRTSFGSVTTRPGISPTGRPEQDLPSTYRPNYSITDISDPGSVTVDSFGRPVSGSRRPVAQSGLPETTIPGFSVSQSPEPTTGKPSSVYQDSGMIRPGQPGGQAERFKPTEARFGDSVPGVPGTKPAEFGPSSVTTPGYLSPYGHPSDKVIGEDFSGPKQPQKFDPETGYYY